MPKIKSAKKRMRQSEARTERNRAQRWMVKTAVKKARTALTPEAVAGATVALDRPARKGIIHRNAAARRKSRLAKALRKKQG